MASNDTILANGVNLYVENRGKGTPVVLLGGPWFGQRYLAPLAESLAADFQIISYDPRGSGRSDAFVGEEITLAHHLADLEGLRQTVGIERMNLIGHSLGALVCLAYAIERQHNIGALVLANPGPPLNPEMQETLQVAFMGALNETDQAMLEEIQTSPGFADRNAETHEAYFKTLYAAFFSDRDLASRLVFGFTDATAAHALEAEEQLVGELIALDLESRAREVTSPTLVIHSEQDLIPEAFSRLLAIRIPGAQIALLEGDGHFAYMEDPARFRRTLLDFLRSNAV